MLTTSPAPWPTKAACQGMDQAVFYPDDDLTREERTRANRAAAAICAECPVKAECLADAICRKETEGVWGGLSPRQRDILARTGRRATPPVLPDTTADMIRRYQAGELVASIAASYGLESTTIRGRLERAGVPRRPREAVKRVDRTPGNDQVRARYLAGETTRAIGESMGLSAEAVRKRLIGLGVAIRPRGGRHLK